MTRGTEAELERLIRRVTHAEQQYAANLMRAYQRVPPDLAPAAEDALSLEPGALATWLAHHTHDHHVPLPLPGERGLFGPTRPAPPINGNGHHNRQKPR